MTDEPNPSDEIATPPAPPEVKLGPCPCGKTPMGLFIEMPERGKYGRTMGDCCAEWQVEFRNGFTADQDETLAKAQRAWNNAPRVPLAAGQAPQT